MDVGELFVYNIISEIDYQTREPVLYAYTDNAAIDWGGVSNRT